MIQKILVVDDNNEIRKAIHKFLALSGLSVISTDNGSQGLLLVRDSRPDLILIDAEMPGLDGHAVCRVIRRDAATRQIPIIIMSGARIGDKDVLSGFDGGADDYVLKPFAFPVLLARMQAVMRRCAKACRMGSPLKKSGVELDLEGRTVTAGGKIIALTRKEFDLLAILTAKAGRILTVPYLLETVWGYDPACYNDPGTVEVHMSRLRAKLGPKMARRLVKVLGVGYKLKNS